MPETQVYNPSEQRIAPDEASAAESVFNGVYQSFADVAKNAPTKRSDFIDGEVKSVAVDPVHEFVKARFETANKTIEPLASQPVRPSDIHDKFLHEATIEAKKDIKVISMQPE
jgi:hypothetical protein